MKTKPSDIAQKLLNLYRQEHVIYGGWPAVNPIFVKEATEEVLEALEKLPTGKKLIKHIENLRSGKTAMDSIEVDLLPYGGLMTENSMLLNVSKEEMTALEEAINSFVPDQDGLDRFKSLDIIKKFGDEWLVAVRAVLSNNQEMLSKWAIVYKTYRAHYLWKVANDILMAPISERTRAQVQADLPEYETYLPMFGEAGNDILSKLRVFVTVI